MGKKDKDEKDEKDQDDGPDLVDISVPISEQAVDMLESLSDLGIYGPTPEEVAGRFVEERLQEFAGMPAFAFKKIKKD